MTQSFIVRLMTADDQLLAWAKVEAKATPQDGRASCPFWPVKSPTLFAIEQDGIAAKLTVHWADLDIARTRDLTPTMDVRAGQTAQFMWIEPVWLVSGMRDVLLPGVTVHGAVTVAPPPAAMGVVDPRTP